MHIYSWFIWLYISHPSKMKGQVKDTSDDKSFLDFGPILGEGWLVENCIYHCYNCLDSSALWILNFTVYYELCNSKVAIVLPNWRLESQGAIYPYEWCSYYELRASIGGNEGENRTGSILKAGLHHRPDCGLCAICPVSMEMTYQLENQAPWVEEPQGSYLDSLLCKRIP